MKTVSRKQALTLGLSRYFTGKPCRNGHINERYTNGRCVSCAIEWQINNRDSTARGFRQWAKNNSSKIVAKGARRRATVLQRTPSWLTDSDWETINFFYDCCPTECHVDHIIPLCGETVTGLHVPNNLQWLPKEINMAKGNRYE